MTFFLVFILFVVWVVCFAIPMMLEAWDEHKERVLKLEEYRKRNGLATSDSQKKYEVKNSAMPPMPEATKWKTGVPKKS